MDEFKAEQAYNFWESRLPNQFRQPLLAVESVTGRHTLACLIDGDGKKWFAKFNEATNNLNEVKALESLNQDALSRRHVASFLFDQFKPEVLLTSSLIGNHPNKTHILKHKASLVGLLANVHQIQDSSLMKEVDYASLFLPLPEHKLTFWLSEVATNVMRTHRTSELGFLHGDLVPGNLLLNDTSWFLLDWEFSHVGDVRWDLASVAVEFAFTLEQFHELCREYSLVRKLDEGRFLTGAKYWILLYLRICLGWSNANNQPHDKYWQYIENNLLL